MLEWSDYVDRLLKEDCAFDSISLSIGSELQTMNVPPIVKVSVLILDRMIVAQGQYNILVFPEKSQSAFILALTKLIHNITGGKIEKAYNPESFFKGEKLKFQNCVVAFNRIDVHNGVPHLWVDDADCTVGAPIEMMPLFQRTNTNRRLSKDLEFSKAKKLARGRLESLPQVDRQLSILADYKTHMESSIFYIAPVISTKEQILSYKINGKAISDIFLVGQANYEGEIKNIGAGQLTGIPSIVLASDLYSFNAAVEKGAHVQSAIIDISNSNIFESQLDALDNLIRKGFPIVCITDTANSFELEPFVDRRFNSWRWDEDSITDKLYNVSPIVADEKIKNCVQRHVYYVTADGGNISESMELLYGYRTDIKEKSPRMIDLFDKLFSLTFTALRTIVPLNETQIEYFRSVLEACEIDLVYEKPFISDNTYNDYNKVIENLSIVFEASYSFSKISALSDDLMSNNYKSICIIVPDRMDKELCRNYWSSWCRSKGLKTEVSVVYPVEYCSLSNLESSIAIVVGWLNKNTMRKVLYGYVCDNYIILLYEYERRWKDLHTTSWSRVLNNGNNKSVIKKSLCTDNQDIYVDHFQVEALSMLKSEADEVEEIELILRENKYRQYVIGGGRHDVEETTDAVPVNFVGGFLSFYKTSHKLITATDIVINDSEKIETKLPSELRVGDFIVVREATRDIIKELADKILENSGKGNMRELATMWKESLEIWRMLSSLDSIDKIYKRLIDVGCTKNYLTVRGWLLDDDIIAPQQKEDLLHIAQVTEDDVLAEMIDQVFDAAREVKRAHTQAGKNLSELLKREIASALKEYGDIDPFNIWEPITMVLDGIGTIKILKVIDIGDIVVVDLTDTNRLVEER